MLSTGTTCNSTSCSCCPFLHQLRGIECSTTVTICQHPNPYQRATLQEIKVATVAALLSRVKYVSIYTSIIYTFKVPVGSRSFWSTLDLPLSWQSLRGMSMQQRRSAQHDRIGAGARTRGESNPTSDAASRLSNHHPGDPASARSPGIFVVNFQTRTP